MAVVGIHEIQLVPSLSGFQKSVGRQLDGQAGQLGERAGRTMGSRLGGALKVGGIAAGAAAVAGLGTALTRGFGRLTAIENARANLTGLGHDAQSVEKIMTNATAAVKGTAFGLDQAASAAASAVASGVKPGEDLERTLKLIGDAATIAGADYGEMASIFNKVSAAGIIQGEELAQLGDRGIPILQLLADELGVSAQQVKKLAADGEVDFATFQNAMEKGMGGAALKSGETMQGAMANAMASIGRFGANLMAGVYPHVRDFFNGFIGFMEPLEAGAKTAGDALGKFLSTTTTGMQGLWDLVVNRDYTANLREAFGIYEDSGFVDFVIRARDAVAGLTRLIAKGDYAGQLREAFGWEEDSAAVTAILKMREGVEWFVTTGIPKIGDFGRAMWDARDQIKVAVTAIAVLLIPSMMLSATEAAKSAAAHVTAWATKRREAVKTAWQYQVSAYTMIGHMVATSATMVATAAVHAFTWGRMGTAALINGAKIAAGWLLAMGPIGWVIGAVAGIAAIVIMNWDRIVQFTRPVWEAIAGFVSSAWESIVGAVEAGMAWLQTNVVPVFEDVWAGIQGAAGAVVDWFQRTLVSAFEWVSGAIGAAFEVAGDIMDAVWTHSIKPLFDGMAAAATWLWESVLSPAFEGIAAAFKFVGDVLSAVYNATLKPVFDAIGAVVGWLWQHVVRPFFYNISQFAILAFDIIVYAWKNLLAPMLATFGAVLWALWKDRVEKVFQFIGTAWGGLVNGVRDLWNGVLAPTFAAVGSFLLAVWNNVISNVIEWFADSWNVMVEGVRFAWTDILKPVFDAVGVALNWLWVNVVSPVLTWVGDLWARMVRGWQRMWAEVLLPVIQAVGQWLTALWADYVRPVLGWIGDRWGGMVNGIRDLWNGVLKPVWDAVGQFIQGVWTNYVQPAFRAIGDAWGGMVNGIKSFWNDTLKPVLKAFGDFVYITVVKRIEDGVKLIKDAWNGIADGFRGTINWVLENVWNKGIVPAFNNVARVVDSEAKLIEADLIPAYAKGGRHKGGWALVGEEGPELVNFSAPGRVYTAAQTAKALTAGRDLSEAESRKAAGTSPNEARLPMGEFNGAAAWDEFKRQTGLGKLLGTDALVAGIGQLGEFAKSALDPILNAARGVLGGHGGFGDILLGAARKSIASVIDWATGKDKSAQAGGSFGGDYTGPRSGFTRPSGGPITSWFGPRWGTTHTGIDFAAPIGSVIRAAWNGVVQRAAWNALAGHTGMGMVLGHGGGRGSYYGHLSKWLKRPGQQVRAGEAIALSGNTGRSTGPHLHFGVLQGGRPVNANALLRDNGGRLPPGLSAVMNATGGYEHVFNQRQIGALESAVT